MAPEGRLEMVPMRQVPKKSYYKANPWLTYDTPEFYKLAAACYKFYHAAKFPILTDDAVEMVLERLEDRSELDSPEAFALYGEPKGLIGRFLTQNLFIWGRQLRRNGIRSRFYVLMKPKQTAESVKMLGLVLGLEDDV